MVKLACSVIGGQGRPTGVVQLIGPLKTCSNNRQFNVKLGC